MMVLYSGTTCPFSHRCRFVLFEKGMDFEIRDVDLYNKPEDINVMNPYGQVPILVERDLILYESNIINEYIDERFPHPQLMPGDPVDRARVRFGIQVIHRPAKMRAPFSDDDGKSDVGAQCDQRDCRKPEIILQGQITQY